jgi:hypothetical protein
MVGTRSIEEYPKVQIKRVRVVRRADGYYVQFCVQTERTIAHQHTGKQIGIDVGLASFTTDSEGVSTSNPPVSAPSPTETEALASAGVTEEERFEEPREGPETLGQSVAAWQSAA